jgi:two-component system, chemotaxis family, chemotaxis protein CheY
MQFNPDKIPLGLKISNKEPYNVFVVDDSPTIRLFIKRSLVRLNFNVTGEANNGEQAIDRLKQGSIIPDIVCVDQEMPIMNGIQTIKEIKKFFPNMKIVFITSHSEGHFVKEVLQLGVHSYIVKPFDLESLTRKLAVLLGRKDILGVLDKEIDKIDLSQIRLPNLPSVFTYVVSFDLEDPKNGIAELEKIISPDVSFSSSIIRSANSAFYGRSGTIRNLKDAISVMGIKEARRLVIDQYNRTLSNPLKEDIFVKHLREMPVLSSLISHDILAPLKLKNLESDIFVVSMMKKIGMNILALNFKDKYHKILKLYEYGVKSLYDLERDEIGYDSTEIGKKAFEIWKMPEHFIKVIAFQNFNKDEAEFLTDMDRVTRISELIAKRLHKISLTEKENDLIPAILSFYNKPASIIDIFNQDYFEMINDHPFMQSLNG